MLRLDRRRFLSIAAACGAVPLSGCDENDTAKQETDGRPELLVYCGITMVKPTKVLAQRFEERANVKMTISQGGSEDLYQSAKASRIGDLYMPGSASYRKKHINEGLLGDFATIGYNKAAIMVAKGNPKSVTGDPGELLRPDLAAVICDPDTGSIGRETKRILDTVGIYDQVFKKVLYLTTDSRNLNNAVKSGDADVIINWRATGFFPENRPKIDVIDMDPSIATPKELQLNLLTFSAHPDLARKFMDLASSPEGQAVFREFGFLDKDMNAG